MVYKYHDYKYLFDKYNLFTYNLVAKLLIPVTARLPPLDVQSSYARCHCIALPDTSYRRFPIRYPSLSLYVLQSTGVSQVDGGVRVAARPVAVGGVMVVGRVWQLYSQSAQPQSLKVVGYVNKSFESPSIDLNFAISTFHITPLTDIALTIEVVAQCISG